MGSANQHPQGKTEDGGTGFCCFFCAMEEPDPQIRRPALAGYFCSMPRNLDDPRHDQEHVLALSSLWAVAMAKPSDSELPALGILRCMALLIRRALNDPSWLRRGQNVYIPYYAAHVLGSYTISSRRHAELAAEAGAVAPLLGLFRGGMTWVEQRAAVRALGHLASYDGAPFAAIARYEEEIVELAMRVASTCIVAVYTNFVAARATSSELYRDGGETWTLLYQKSLLTRGLGGSETEEKRAEEWASQLQCWSLYLLCCFASRRDEHGVRARRRITCHPAFLKDLAGMWGGLANGGSTPAGVGLMRILCRSEEGRAAVASCPETVESLCRLTRSSDDWQYMGVDCLVMLLGDTEVRQKVINGVAPCLADLVELQNLGSRRVNVGDAITQALLQSFTTSEVQDGKAEAGGVCSRSRAVIEEVWELKVERRRREERMTEDEMNHRRALAGARTRRGNDRFRAGDVKAAASLYGEALTLCPLGYRRDRAVAHSNRAQCHLLLGDPESAVSDATRGLALGGGSRGGLRRTLWRRAQAYDAMGMPKESLMDSLMLVRSCLQQDNEFGKNKKNLNSKMKVPHYAARMINKQMGAAGLFAAFTLDGGGTGTSSWELQKGNPPANRGLPTILEEP